MKKLMLYFLFLLPVNYGISQISFQKIIGNSNSTYAYDVIQVQDTGYVIAGTSTGYGDYSANAFLMKLDSTGAFLWTKWFGGNNIDGAKQVIENMDGSLVFVGHTNSSGNGGYDIWVVKTDASGNVLWQKTYGGSDWDFGKGIMLTSDNNYVITGETYSFGSGNTDAFLLKLDANGDSLWMNAYGSTKHESGEKVIETYDGKYLFIGTSDSLVADTGKYWLVKTNSNGSFLWNKFYGTSLMNYGRALVESQQNSEIVLIGSGDSSGLQWENHIYRLDSTGNIICNWSYGGPDNDYGNDITELPSMNLLLAGEGYSYGNGVADMKSFVAMPACWWMGGTTYGDDEYEAGYAIAKTIDGGYIEAGTSTGGPGIINVFIVKADASLSASGTITTFFDVTTIDETGPYSAPVLYYDLQQNTIHITGCAPVDSRISLYDLNGRVVLVSENTSSVVSVAALAPGCYIYSLENNGFYYSGKIVKY